MFGYVILGVMVGAFLGINLGVLLMSMLSAARDWPVEVDA
jgi:hypothetical protein